ncbi:polyketide synthase dehydratase domain-containing protein, partial [Planomonospora alba]|uniref:polyketide synthase dehydratase domain-containing protein n=1 Tax=Planomonospora alba TaxID=161354 RepID=UPI0031E86DFC
ARRVELPTYAFQRKRYWLDPASGRGDVAAAGLAATDHPLLGAVVRLPDTDGLVATGRLSVETHPWLAEHAVQDTVVVPGAALLDLVVWAGDRARCGTVEELTMEAPLVLPEHGGIRLQVVVGEPGENGSRSVGVYSRPDGGAEPEALADDVPWTRHATGLLLPGTGEAPAGLEQWPPAGADPVEIETLYDELAGAGLVYGPLFQGLRAAWRRDDEVFTEVTLPEGTEADGFGLHPALLDAALHGIALLEDGEVRLPFAWTGVALHATGASAARVRITRTGPGKAALEIADAAGAPVASVASLATRTIAPEQFRSAGGSQPLYRVEWRSSTAAAVTAGPCALLGEDVFGLGGLPGVTGVYADLAALAAASAPGSPQGTAVPETVLLPVPATVTGAAAGDVRVEGVSGGTDVPAVVRAVADRVLGLVQEWLAE